jgi:hypothetical protein
MAIEEISTTVEEKKYKCSDGKIYPSLLMAQINEKVLELEKIIEVNVIDFLFSGKTTVTILESINETDVYLLSRAICKKAGFEEEAVNLVVCWDIGKGTYFICEDSEYSEPGDKIYELVKAEDYKVYLEKTIQSYQDKIDSLKEISNKI